MVQFKNNFIVMIAVLALLFASCQSDYELVQLQQNATASANPNRIPLSEAINTADATMNLIVEKTRSKKKTLKSVSCMVRPHNRSVNDIDTALYLVNYEGGGFALLGADRRLNDIYAISETGNLDWTDTISNPGLRLYFDILKESIEQIEDKDVVNTNSTRSADAVITLVEKCYPRVPAIARQWNQRSPYNAYCFTDSGEQAVVGCLPLACGIAMSTFRWPTYYKGTYLPWSTMIGNPLTSQLAWMLCRLGDEENCNVTYGTNSTNGYFANVERTLIAFGYTRPVLSDFNEAKAKKWLGNTLWEDVDGGVIIMQGRTFPIQVEPEPILSTSPTAPVTHAWVIDGYFTTEDSSAFSPILTQENYFHCVWGKENGANNGYYNWTMRRSFGGEPDEFEEDDSQKSVLTPKTYQYDLQMFTNFIPNK